MILFFFILSLPSSLSEHHHCAQLGCFKLPLIGNQSFIISTQTGEQWPIVKCHGQTAEDLLLYLDLLTYPKSYEDIPSHSKICSTKCWTITQVVPLKDSENCHALANWIVVDKIWSSNVDKLSYEDQVEEKFAVFGRDIFCQAVAHNRECSENCTIHFSQCDPIHIYEMLPIFKLNYGDLIKTLIIFILIILLPITLIICLLSLA